MSSSPIPLSRYQYRLLAVLALINFVNFADRQIFVPLLPLLRAHLGVSDAQLGSLQTWLLVVLAVASIPSGFLADRLSRRMIIACGVLFWSLATFCSGLASSFVILAISRAMVGVGEAAYAPAAQSMISGAFPQERRAFAQAIFASGMLIGGASGLALGGIMGEHQGWQHAFFLAAIGGLLPGLAVLGCRRSAARTTDGSGANPETVERARVYGDVSGRDMHYVFKRFAADLGCGFCA